MHPIADLFICLRFFTRLPVPVTRREIELGARGFSVAAAMVPVAGAVVGLVPASMLLAASVGGVPPLPSAALAIATLTLLTGALHEDALADCADGFGGGVTRDRKLDIMRDSRIGTFGACAIALSLTTRIAALATLAADPWLATVAVVVAASSSRTLCLLPLRLLPPARTDGLAVAAGKPSRLSLATAAIIAVGVCLGLVHVAHVSSACVAATVVLPLAGAALVSLTAYRQIGGQTGDVVGATQQVAECLALLALTPAVRVT